MAKRYLYFFFLWLSFLLISAVLIPASSFAESSNIRSPLPTDQRLNGITYGNDLFVAVGHNGTILTSNDGATWESQISGTTDHLYNATYANGTYVAVGAIGTILTSVDGVNWTNRSTETPNDFKGIVYGNNMFMAVGENGTILTSSDGAIWTGISETTDHLASVTFGDGKFVVLGSNGVILTSSYGVTWAVDSTNAREGYYGFFDISFSNGIFIKAALNGYLATSIDGETWTKVSSNTTNHLFRVAQGDKLAVVGEYGTILTSSNGTNWTSQTSGTSNDLNGVVYANGTYVVVGDSGTVLTSTDGSNWTNRTNGTPNTLKGVVYDNGTYVAVGANGTIVTSSNGTSWGSHIWDLPIQFNSVSFGNGMFVAVGYTGTILTSSDGTSWTNPPSVTTEILRGVTYGNGKFVAVGSTGTILTSSDGLEWTSVTSGSTADLMGVANGNNMFVAFGGGGVLTSSNGESWTYHSVGSIYSVSFGDGKFVASGSFGAIWNSSDGESWTRISTGAEVNLYGVAYGNGMYMAVGGNGTLLTSKNGVDWTSRASDTSVKLNGVAYGDRTYIAVGDGGTILQFSDADLEGLTLSSGTLSPAFAPHTSSYTANVVNAVSSITVTPKLWDSGATVKVNGESMASGSTSEAIDLNVGSNTVTVVVTSQDGMATQTYTVTVTRAADAPATYTVTFDSQGGSHVDSLTGVITGATITAPASPTKSGFTFGGWYKEASYVTLWDFDTDKVTTNITLYAKWTAVPPTTFTVTFDSQEGSNVDSLTGVITGATISAPAAPTKSGFTFEGWYKEASLDTLWDFGTDTVTTNITLYAKWTAIPPATYTVTFDSQGGSTVDSATGVSAGATITAPASPTKSGFTFGGWYKEASYVTLWNFGTDKVTANITLYAKWTAVSGGGSDGGGGGGGSGGPAAPDDSKLTSEDGELSLPAGRTGEVSLGGDEISIEIPADVADKDLKLTIEKWLDTQSLLSDKEVLLSEVFEILKNFKENFKKPVKLTFAFDPAKLSGGERPSIFYYDEVKKEWVEVGGIVYGNFITAEVDHFTKFAVFAVDPIDEPKIIELSDIHGHWAEDAINQAVSDGIASGYPDGTFQPNHTVTRAELAVMLMNALKLTGEGSALTFTDNAKIPPWAQNAVQQAVYAGIINGYDDDTFRPDAQITRSEMAAMIAKALKLEVEEHAATGFADDESIPSWVRGSVAELRELGLMKGKGGNRFDPKGKVTRAEAVTVLLGMLEP